MRRKVKAMRHLCTIILLISILLLTPTPAYASSQYFYPVFKDGMLIWHYMDHTFGLPLGDPETGGWFSFPYLYTIYQGKILIWDVTEGFPKLIGSFEEPNARNLVMIGNKLLIEVPDGFDIFVMETPTNPVTYGGTLAPCEKGQLLWHGGNVFITCPNGVYVWNSKEFEFTPTTTHPTPEPIPMPIPPMVWGEIIGASGRYALVSKTIPLMLISSGTLTYAGEMTASISKGTVEVIRSRPPYTPILKATGTPVVGDGAVLIKTPTGSIIVSASGTIKTNIPVKSVIADGEHGLGITASGKLIGLSFNPPATWTLMDAASSWKLKIINNKVFVCLPPVPHISVKLEPYRIDVFYFHKSSCRDLQTGTEKSLPITDKPLTWLYKDEVLKCIPTPAGKRFNNLSTLPPDIIKNLMCLSVEPAPVLSIPTYWAVLVILGLALITKIYRRHRGPIKKKILRRQKRKVWRYGSGGL